MPRRLSKLVPVGEKTFDESFGAPVPIVSFLPVENGEHRRRRDRVDGLSFRNQGRILLIRKLTNRIVIGEDRRKRNRQEVQTRIGGDLRKKVNRLSDHADERGKFTRLQLLQGGGVVIQYLLDLDAEPLKDNRAGEARSTSCWPEIHLLAAQVLDRRYVAARENVHLRYGQANDVIDSILEIGNFSLSTEIFKDIRLSHRDVDVAQIEQIIKIGSGAIGNDRNDPQIVAVIEDLRQLIGKGHVSTCQLSACDAKRPIVLSPLHCGIGATLRE